MNHTNLTLALENKTLRQEALETLRECSETLSWTEKDPRDWAALLNHLNASESTILMVDAVSPDGDPAFTIRQVRAQAPHVKVIAVHPDADPQAILAAMRGGATEFVHTPLGNTLPIALARMGEGEDNAGSAPRQGKLLAFLSAKGGCGATTLACHIASELQRQTASEVLLADFDFTSGIAGFLMKATCPYSVLDAVQNISRLDASLWKALLATSRPKLSVLPAPSSISHGQYPDENEFKHVLRFMRTQHEWTVIDLGRSLTRTARAVLEEVDELFLISTLEVMSLHGLKAIVRAAPESQASKLHLVLNRTPKMMDITVEELEKILCRPLYARLPNDYPSLYASYANGTLLPANTRLGEHFTRFAARIAGKEDPAKNKKRFSFF